MHPAVGRAQVRRPLKQTRVDHAARVTGGRRNRSAPRRAMSRSLAARSPWRWSEPSLRSKERRCRLIRRRSWGDILLAEWFHLEEFPIAVLVETFWHLPWSCIMIRHNGEDLIMKKRFGIVLNIVLVLMVVSSARAKDRLAIGYSSASGVFAGLWVAQEGRLFEKYDIE